MVMVIVMAKEIVVIMVMLVALVMQMVWSG